MSPTPASRLFSQSNRCDIRAPLGRRRGIRSRWFSPHETAHLNATGVAPLPRCHPCRGARIGVTHGPIVADCDQVVRGNHDRCHRLRTGTSEIAGGIPDSAPGEPDDSPSCTINRPAVLKVIPTVRFGGKGLATCSHVRPSTDVHIASESLLDRPYATNAPSTRSRVRMSSASGNTAPTSCAEPSDLTRHRTGTLPSVASCATTLDSPISGTSIHTAVTSSPEVSSRGHSTTPS